MAKELALLTSQCAFPLGVEDIPGIAHKIADGLSRLDDPSHKGKGILCHAALAHAGCTEIPARVRGWHAPLIAAPLGMRGLRFRGSWPSPESRVEGRGCRGRIRVQSRMAPVHKPRDASLQTPTRALRSETTRIHGIFQTSIIQLCLESRNATAGQQARLLGPSLPFVINPKSKPPTHQL